MSNQVKGTVKEVQQMQSFPSKKGGEDFKKQTVVLDYQSGEYTNQIALDFTNDKIQALNGVKVGDEVEVSYDVRANPYNGKWYNNINAYKLQVLNQSQNATTSSYTGNPKQADTSDFGNPQGMYTPKPAAAVVEEDDSQLPF